VQYELPSSRQGERVNLLRAPAEHCLGINASYANKEFLWSYDIETDGNLEI
jgi:hypothetical protein